MPMYVYECPFCLERREEYRTIDTRDHSPECHRRPMTRRIMPTMVSVFTPYQTVAFDKETGKRMTIRNSAEHRAFLARNKYDEVGNDRSMAPPSPEELRARRASHKADGEAAPVFSEDDLRREGWIAEDL